MHPIFSLCHMHCDGQEGQEARLCHIIHPSDQSRIRLDHQIARFCLKFVIPCYGYALFHIVFKFSSPAAALPPALGVSDVFPPGKPCTVGWTCLGHLGPHARLQLAGHQRLHGVPGANRVEHHQECYSDPETIKLRVAAVIYRHGTWSNHLSIHQCV